MYFYLAENENMNLDFIEETYKHIKSKTDGTGVAIIPGSEITDENVIEKTQEELQGIINGWIDEENSDPPLDVDGNELLQSLINLNKFL